MRPTPGRWIAMTLVLFELHVTPTHELQTGAESFQLSLRACGILEANSKRACLSEFRSAITKTQKDSKKLNKSSTEIEEWNFMDACLVQK